MWNRIMANWDSHISNVSWPHPCGRRASAGALALEAISTSLLETLATLLESLTTLLESLATLALLTKGLHGWILRLHHVVTQIHVTLRRVESMDP